jgi:phosphate acetyltransferase
MQQLPSGLSGPRAETQAPVPLSRRARLHADFDPVQRLQALLKQGEGLAPARCAVVHPCDTAALQGAIEAARQGLIDPVIVGPLARIQSLAQEAQIDLSAFELIACAHSHEAAQRAAALAAAGSVEGLMKGSLHTDELMAAVLAEKGLRTRRRLSHVFRFEVPLYDKPLLITDAALNIHPGLMDKVDIVQNAIDLSSMMGCSMPRVAILSAVETVNPALTSTLDAAALCKMADRGQITGALLDGPLAFDNAISPDAARIKGIDSRVAGQADILVVPDLESGNLLSKQLQYLAGAMGCGIVLGARVPIALTSRADDAVARVASALLLQRVAHRYRHQRP